MQFGNAIGSPDFESDDLAASEKLIARFGTHAQQVAHFGDGHHIRATAQASGIGFGLHRRLPSSYDIERTIA